MEMYTQYGSQLIPNMESHHVSKLKWALDCLLLLTPNSTTTLHDHCTTKSDTGTTTTTTILLPFPKSIHDAYTALNLPFCILPQCLSMLDRNNRPISVHRIMEQVNFRTDDIVTTATGESVTERRWTAWQGDAHVAPFSYSGKVMIRDDWSPIVLYIRDQLYNRTGQYYDGCLLNLYHTGKSGMRYHSDPDQGTLWDYDTAVVSIGASRRFVFRSISTATTSHQPQQQIHSFVVMNSDVTYMFNDCQAMYQHSLKNAEDKQETASRISLVFKRTYQLNNDDNISSSSNNNSDGVEQKSIFTLYNHHLYKISNEHYDIVDMGRFIHWHVECPQSLVYSRLPVNDLKTSVLDGGLLVRNINIVQNKKEHRQ